jgi:hypothetical protein
MGEMCPRHCRSLKPNAEGKNYALTFQDELSKYTLAIPMEQQEAVTVAKAFVEF